MINLFRKKIFKLKDQIIKIMNAIIKAGTDIERDIYPKMKYRALYMNDEKFEKKDQEKN